ncbi:hypothetical protein NW754_004897 [Fusarium falciforme]|uniref:DUF2263 domain-containing protein n=1 Tax=Fusarium falciforme TaxID=195108 RepID=UPI002300FFE0|nr:DUF2263 domain-containing protein [Fusarium falciforme]KAJ4174479.1 hypothetical protein NW754_004897 [Fusarium falciforme]KAJ4208589.1 hypothetical protein NW767_001697 [Fusarium falciforme]KAJ4257700.1 hypothetical protein NW757_003325 [Fusarium falciforme]WAO90476.1 DUF2263 domain-containing protein [Fusarium falciforme]
MSSNSGQGQGQGTLDMWLSKKPSSKPAASTSEQPSSSSTPASSSSQPSRSWRNRRKDPWRQGAGLAAVAKETRTVLPDILNGLPDIEASKSEALYYETLQPLKAAECPKRTPSGTTTIKIVNDDSFNAAIDLASSKDPSSGRVAVLNMASNVSPGGGWLKGARAQEEALCYRSSLYLSLHRRYYPWKQRMGVYSPDVVIIRSDQDSGHKLLMPDVDVENLPIVSVLSIAALRTPPVARAAEKQPDGSYIDRLVFANPTDRDMTKIKMRICLRMAARRNHGLLVLGALGCGAFRNPPKEVAHCWLEVLQEPEFQGGWWEEVWFAVFDRRNEGNLEVFEEVLGGVEI